MKKVSNFDTRPTMPIPQQRTKAAVKTAVNEPNMAAAAFAALWQSISRKWIALVSLSIGLFVGLVIFGWGLWPVQWTGMSYSELTSADKMLLIELAVDLNVYDANNPSLQKLQQRWPEIDDLACFVANDQQATEADKIKFVYLAYKINQTGC